MPRAKRGLRGLVAAACVLGGFNPVAVLHPASAAAATEPTYPFVNQNLDASGIDTHDFQPAIDPGALTISTPYTPSNPFVLPPLTLSSDGSYLSTSATFPASTDPSTQQIVVASTLAGDPGWTLTVSASDLTNGSGGAISDSGLGLTEGTLDGGSCSPGPAPYYQTCSASSSFSGSISFTDRPAHNPSPEDTDSNIGLSSTGGSSGVYQFATTPAGIGTAVMSGTLTLLAPTSTPPGTYSGTISFTVS
jgi:hypothetical protein